jgi:NAD(P)-dependent dehydrogenase (short-subunit alcohol dehydrogenase family)
VKKLGLGDINFKAIEATASELSKQYPKLEIHTMQLDVASEQSIDDAIASTAQKFGTIDYAVNNAGVAGPLVLSAEHSSADWRSVMNVNLDGVWMSQRAEIRQMLKQKPGDSYRTGRGVIINMSSMYGLIGTSMNTPAVAYTTSKHAVIGMDQYTAQIYQLTSRRHNKS